MLQISTQKELEIWSGLVWIKKNYSSFQINMHDMIWEVGLEAKLEGANKMLERQSFENLFRRDLFCGARARPANKAHYPMKPPALDDSRRTPKS